MTTTTRAHDAAVAITTSYALRAVADHIDDQWLPAPMSVDVDREVTIWVRTDDATSWLNRAITVNGFAHERVGDHIRHIAAAVLHGNSVRVNIRWLTPVDHEVCRNGDCDLVICYCESTTPCEGTVGRGCGHVGEILCDDHRGDCVECRIEWSR